MRSEIFAGGGGGEGKGSLGQIYFSAVGLKNKMPTSVRPGLVR